MPVPVPCHRHLWVGGTHGAYLRVGWSRKRCCRLGTRLGGAGVPWGVHGASWGRGELPTARAAALPLKPTDGTEPSAAVPAAGSRRPRSGGCRVIPWGVPGCSDSPKLIAPPTPPTRRAPSAGGRRRRAGQHHGQRRAGRDTGHGDTGTPALCKHTRGGKGSHPPVQTHPGRARPSCKREPSCKRAPSPCKHEGVQVCPCRCDPGANVTLVQVSPVPVQKRRWCNPPPWCKRASSPCKRAPGAKRARGAHAPRPRANTTACKCDNVTRPRANTAPRANAPRPRAGSGCGVLGAPPPSPPSTQGTQSGAGGGGWHRGV